MNCKEHHLPELELATGQVREALQVLLHTILFIRSPGSVIPQDVECEGFDLTYTRIDQRPQSNHNNSNMGGHHGNSSHHHSGGSSSNNSNNNHHPYSTTTTNNKNNNNNTNVEQKVDDAIESFLRSLSQIGPELMSGCLVLSFFERRASKQLFGLVSHEERLVWEQWMIRVVVNNTPRPISNDSAAIMERQRVQDTAEGMLRSVLDTIVLDICAGGDMTHIPPVLYEFEIHSSKTHHHLDNNKNNHGAGGTGGHFHHGKDDRENIYARVANMPSLINLGN